MSDRGEEARARTAVAQAVGILGFLLTNTTNELSPLVEALEKYFMAQGRNRHDSVSDSSADEASDVARFEAACIESWSLLHTVMPVSHVEERLADGLLDKLFELLEASPATGVRVTLAESIALLLELCYVGDEAAEDTESFFRTHLGNALNGFLDLLRQFNTECTKHKSKRDRQSQRKTFREVLDYAEQLQRHLGGGVGGTPANENGHVDGVAKSGPSIQVSRTEHIALNSWSLQRYYDALRQLLGPGLNAHLRGNTLVRNMFELGEPVSAAPAEAPAPARGDASSGEEETGGGGGGAGRRRAHQKKGGNSNKGGDEAGSHERHGGKPERRRGDTGGEEGSSSSEGGGALTKLERVQAHQAQDRVRTKQRSRFKDKRFDRGVLDYD